LEHRRQIWSTNALERLNREVGRRCEVVGTFPNRSSLLRRIAELREGRDGVDFLGCHFHARVSGRLLERGIRCYYLQRWPSIRSVKWVRSRIRGLTGQTAMR
jgi:hypothetical protein